MFEADFSSQSSTWCFSVFAAPEAGVTSRVLELFAKGGVTPSRFHADVVDGGREGLVIDLHVDGLTDEAAHTIAERMRGLVDVERVLTATKGVARRVGAFA